jgi:hypothetical protein
MLFQFWSSGEGDNRHEQDEPETPPDGDDIDTPSDGECCAYADEEPDTPVEQDVIRRRRKRS